MLLEERHRPVVEQIRRSLAGHSEQLLHRSYSSEGARGYTLVAAAGESSFPC